MIKEVVNIISAKVDLMRMLFSTENTRLYKQYEAKMSQILNSLSYIDNQLVLRQSKLMLS